MLCQCHLLDSCIKDCFSAQAKLYSTVYNCFTYQRILIHNSTLKESSQHWLQLKLQELHLDWLQMHEETIYCDSERAFTIAATAQSWLQLVPEVLETIILEMPI